MIGGAGGSGLDYAAELAKFDRYLEIPDGPVGKDFFYSSGTTGKPKGIKQPLFANIAPGAGVRRLGAREFRLR